MSRHHLSATQPVVALSTTLLMALALGGAPSAAAHAARISSDPAEDAVLGRAPDAVTATFNEPLQPAFAAMTVVGPRGEIWSTGDVAVRGATVSIAVAAGAPAGGYTANYRVTSADGHVVTGAWSFHVTTPSTETPSPPGQADATGIASAPEPAPSSPTDPGRTPILVGVAVGAALLGALVWWRTRRAARRR